MRTHEGARASAPITAGRTASVPGSMRQATVTALAALVGGALLVVVGALVSICWTIHPLLTPVALAAVGWVASRLAGLAFCCPGRS